jgi:hypothetical protein
MDGCAPRLCLNGLTDFFNIFEQAEFGKSYSNIASLHLKESRLHSPPPIAL